MLTGGVGAVTGDKYSLNSVVALPAACGLCGLFPGTKVKLATAAFSRGSGASSLVGVNLNSEVLLSYQVCRFCAGRSEEAIHIDKFEKIEEEWHLTLDILNPEVAKRIGELNVPVPDVE